MSAKIMRMVRNIETLPDGTPNPHFAPDEPLYWMETLSQDSVPPEWSKNLDLFVRFPSHGAAEKRCHEIEEQYRIHCFARTLERDPNELESPASFAPAPPAPPPRAHARNRDRDRQQVRLPYRDD